MVNNNDNKAIKKSSPISVLIVNTDTQAESLVRSFLMQSQYTRYRLIKARNLEESINAITANTCDVVLLNYYWGKTRIGDKFLQWARAKFSHIPIIVFTRRNEPDIDRQAAQLGAADYLSFDKLTAQKLDRSIRYVSGRRVVNEQINYLAQHDFLTGMPNRNLFQQRLRHSIHIAKQRKTPFALLIVEIKELKSLNERHGHTLGDYIVKQYATHLNRIAKHQGSVARTGDGEFALVVRDFSKPEELSLIAKSITNISASLIEFQGQHFETACSVGVAQYYDFGMDDKQLQSNALVALSHAREHPASHYEFHTKAMTPLVAKQTTLQQSFVKALATNEIGLYFNPRIQCANDEIVAIEVNPYWSHPEKGMLEYEQFLWNDLNNDLSVRFTEWLLATSFEYFNQLNISKSIKLIFNIDFQGLFSLSFPDIVEKHLKNYGIDGSQIEFDLSNVKMEKHNAVLENSMDKLSAIGVSFGVNHFGTEEASISYLMSLPTTVLKLSGEFVSEINNNQAEILMAKALVDLGHSLGKQVLIEGHHNHLSVDDIKDLGFDLYKSVFTVDALSLAKLQDVVDKDAIEKQTKTKATPLPRDKQ
ncbi:MAG: EAL domain-containing protein [Pseudomonadota bacterium]